MPSELTQVAEPDDRVLVRRRELAANATNILRQFLVPHFEFEVNRAFRRFLTELNERFQGKWNPHPLMPSSDGLDWLPQASPTIEQSPTQNGQPNLTIGGQTIRDRMLR